MPDAAIFDIFATWYGKGGVGLVFAVCLFLLVRWVGNRLSASEDKLRAALDHRSLEDQKARERKDEQDRKSKDAMVLRIRELEESRYRDGIANGDKMVKALADCALSNQENSRSRRRLDITLRSLVITMNNLPCNRLAPPATGQAGAFKTPLPEETPISGMENISDEDTQTLDAVDDRASRGRPPGM